MDHQKTSKLFAKIVKGIAETGDLHGHSKIVISSHIESYPIYTYVKRCQEMSRDVKRCQEDHSMDFAKKFRSKFLSILQLDVGEGGGCDVVGSGRRVSEIKHKVLCNQRQNVEVQHLLIFAFL